MAQIEIHINEDKSELHYLILYFKMYTLLTYVQHRPSMALIRRSFSLQVDGPLRK